MPSSADHRPTSITQADLDSRLLRYFLAVVREGSIRKAADTMNVAPSAISRQISDLELRLGLPLLERLPRGVIPTEAGKAMADHARQQVEDGDRLIDHLKQLHGLLLGAIKIRCGEGFVGDLIENGIQPFCKIYPDVRLQVTLAGTRNIMAAIADGEVDIGLVYNPPAHVGTRSIAISRQPLHVLTAPESPLSHRKRISLKSVAKEKMALLIDGHGIRLLLNRVEADQGLHLVPHLESSSIDIVRRFAMSGQGLTFLPRFAASTEIAEGRLLAIPMTDFLLAEATAHLLVRSQRRLSKAAEQLAAHLTSHMQAFSQAGRERAEFASGT